MNHLPDSHQNFWQLMSIQVASMGVPGILIGSIVAGQYGVGNAIGAICIGNLILWLMGLVIVAMSHQYRSDSVTNIRQRLGRSCALVAATIFIVAFTFWMVFQIKSSVNVFQTIFENQEMNINSIKLGAVLGLVGSMISMGGIRIIKWVNIICLPILFIFQFFALAWVGRQDIVGPYWGVSLAPIVAIVLFNLVGTATLPNFFRHSRSLADSFFALTLIAVFYSFFQISSIWINFPNLMGSFTNLSYIFLPIALIGLVLLAISNILENIYFASASWEAMLPNFEGPKEYAILGLSGTAAYLFIQISPPMIFLVDLMSDFISNLVLVLFLTYLVQLVVKYKPVTFGKWVGSSSWLVGCVIATILKFQNPDQITTNLTFSLGAVLLFFLCVIFMQESIWSIKKLFDRKKIRSTSSNNPDHLA